MAKVVLLGDSKVGKTSLLITYTSGSFPTEYLPPLFDNFSPRFGPPPPLSFWDTNSSPEYDQFSPVICKGTDFFLLCFSVVDKLSFENVQTRWMRTVKEHCPTARVLLCAMKTDLRNQHKDSITKDMGHKLSKQIDAIGYVEVSALKNIKVNEPFDTMVNFLKDKGAQNGRLKKRECIIS